MKIGKNRPQLMKLIESNNENDIIQITKDAFQNEWPRSLKILCKLKGVGPATSTAIMSLIKEDIPFFSDECAGLLLNADLKYSEKQILEYVDLMRVKAKEFNVNVNDLEKMVFVHWHEEDLLQELDSREIKIKK
jgi:hypothetical protein